MNPENNNYRSYELGEGMSVKEEKRGRRMFLLNHNTQDAWEIKDYNGSLLQWTKDDVDFKSLEGVKNTGDARIMTAAYGFKIGGFKNGRALVSWTLQPEGGYYADDGGFSMTDDEEIKVYGVVDSQCRICYPFSLKDWKEVRRLGMDEMVK